MVMFIERSIRVGLNQCFGFRFGFRYAQANNKYMCSFDSSKSSSYLMYYDNLYGWAMCLPYAKFR